MKKGIAFFLCMALLTGCAPAIDKDAKAPAVTVENDTENTAQSVAAEIDAQSTASSDIAEPDAERTAPADNAEKDTDLGGAQTMTVSLSDGITIPEIAINDFELPENEGLAFAKNLGVGFNLGNTFDAYNDGSFSDEMAIEEYWQHTYTTREMIADIHSYGFTTIRIPVSWHNHLSGDAEISEAWLHRVNEVVDWALDEGMYVILNIHHDNHPEANGFYPDKAHLMQSKHYIERIWTQLAERFADYDERLIFEAMNEPRLVGHENEWWINAASKDCVEAIECINELNQTFVDTVRAKGGRNRTRYLMCPGYDASVDGATHPSFQLPQDADGIKHHLIVSVHAYTPYNFALEYPGIASFDAGDVNSTRDIDSFMNKLMTTFLKNGTPVVIGEFGARDKNGNLQDRVNFCAYYVRAARARGLSCLWWDNNNFSGDGEVFGVYNRKNPENSNTDILSALFSYAGE